MTGKHGGQRTIANWRYRIVKHWRQKVDKFVADSKTLEEIHAWHKVREWIDTLVGRDRIMTTNGAIGLKNFVVMDFRTINQDEKWKEEHFYAQKKGDYAKPNHCMNCNGKEFIDVPQGWRCKECLALVWDSDFYQGRNSMREEFLRNNNEEKPKKETA